jgi:hypothetical protein
MSKYLNRTDGELIRLARTSGKTKLIRLKIAISAYSPPIMRSNNPFFISLTHQAKWAEIGRFYYFNTPLAETSLGVIQERATDTLKLRFRFPQVVSLRKIFCVQLTHVLTFPE